MARIVVHSRNTALPFALGSAGHDVVVVHEDADVRWAEYTAFAEMVVLDVDEPAACAAFVAGITASAQRAPHEVRILLLAGSSEAWEAIDHGPGVAVLHLPLTMTRLTSALDELLAAPALPAAKPQIIDVRAHEPALVGPALLTPVPGDSVTVRPTVPERRVRPVVAQSAPEPPAPRTMSLVRALTAALEDMSSVVETATVVVKEATKVVRSDAAVVLVRDGVAWRVAYGDGLRAREERLTLSGGHWLVEQAGRSFGIVLTGGEGLWPQLYGVPLSWRKNLLAMQLPPAQALLVMARDDEPYSDTDLHAMVALTEEAGQLLCDAVDVRSLARLLEPFCEHPDV